MAEKGELDEMRDWPIPRFSCNSATDSSSLSTSASRRSRVGSERVFRMSHVAFTEVGCEGWAKGGKVPDGVGYAVRNRAVGVVGFPGRSPETEWKLGELPERDQNDAGAGD